jgi:D-galacturonate reductase
MKAKGTGGINLLIIGTGMYVCGRGTGGPGTVLPAVAQFAAGGGLGELFIAGRSRESLRVLEEKAVALRQATSLPLSFRSFGAGEGKEEPWRRALAELPDPGAVIVVTPDHLHHAMALDAIRAGKHVLVVKPLTPTVAEAKQLAEEAEKAGVYGAVEFHKRWDLSTLKMKEALRSGRIGDPLHFLVEFSQRKSIPESIFRGWVENTNIFQYLGVHYADMVHFLTGARPVRVAALAQKGWLAGRGIPTWDTVQALAEWEGGFSSSILTGWVDPESSTTMSQQLIKVVGTRGRFENDQADRGIRIFSDQGGVENLNPYFNQPYQDIDGKGTRYLGYGIDSVTQFLEDAVRLGRGEIAPADLEGKRPTLRDSLPSTAVVEGVNLSLAEGGRWVRFGSDLSPLPA